MKVTIEMELTDEECAVLRAMEPGDERFPNDVRHFDPSVLYKLDWKGLINAFSPPFYAGLKDAGLQAKAQIEALADKAALVEGGGQD